MIRYTVEMTDAALAAITAQARFIAVDSHAPIEARKWLERIWDAVDSLEHWPRRASKAAEDAFVEYEVRQLVVGKHLQLFSVDVDRRLIRIIGLRHGHRLPRPKDLPDDIDRNRSS
jgi:plasmid stabilization system protein ParE